MQGNLCWNCGRLCECDKLFPNGRPRKKGECAEHIEMPPDPPRITHREMALMLGYSMRKIERLIAYENGLNYLTRALARKGISVIYERIKNRVYFYKEDLIDKL